MRRCLKTSNNESVVASAGRFFHKSALESGKVHQWTVVRWKYVTVTQSAEPTQAPGSDEYIHGRYMTTGRLKLQDRKMQDWKLTDKNYRGWKMTDTVLNDS